MITFERVDIHADNLKSLCWQGNTLLDILGGGYQYHLDGTKEKPPILTNYAYPFDSVLSTERYAVLYETLGTKGLLLDLKEGQVLRELNRSFYHATDYDFPIALLQLPDGRDAIVYCPQEYCSLEIEEAASGERLTKREYNSIDIFHSRLKASLDGKYLVENGWVWHPFNVIVAFDVEKAIADPSHLDGKGLEVPYGSVCGWEPHSVTVCGHRTVSANIAAAKELEELEQEEANEFEILPAEQGVEVKGGNKQREAAGENPGADSTFTALPQEQSDYRFLLQVYDLDSQRIVSSRETREWIGPMMPVGTHHVVSFANHPQLLEVETGKVILRWEEIDPGQERWQPSVTMSKPAAPFLAFDPRNHRFAVGSKNGITVVSIHGLE